MDRLPNPRREPTDPIVSTCRKSNKNKNDKKTCTSKGAFLVLHAHVYTFPIVRLHGRGKPLTTLVMNTQYNGWRPCHREPLARSEWDCAIQLPAVGSRLLLLRHLLLLLADSYNYLDCYSCCYSTSFRFPSALLLFIHLLLLFTTITLSSSFPSYCFLHPFPTLPFSCLPLKI